jgi:transposase
MDPFRVVQWMNDALDEVRCKEWQVAKKAAHDAMARRDRPGRPRKGEKATDAIKGSRFALVKNP